MEIRGIDGVRGVDNNSKLSRVSKKSDETSQSADSAEISTEAKQLAEEAKIKSVMDRTPDIRQDKINEVKEKLASGAYDNEEVMKTVADRLMKVLGL